ncbi:hypothetical protein EG827_08890 [bacterium]|nr:hypothetical protein [bacterium]
MPELSLRDIALISRDVSSQEIIFPHLADELIDHICCDVEDEMRNGMSFHDAYSVVRGKIGRRRLKEIQEETLYAVDTKYRNMKRTMKISAIAGTVMLGFSALFKIMHWPFAGLLLTLGGLALAFVFMPSALTVLWKETHNRKWLFLYISAFISGMLFIVGVVSKVQHWPLSGLILAFAALSGIFLLIPAALTAKLAGLTDKRKVPVYILGAAGLTFYILAILFKIQHWPLATLLLALGTIIIFIVVFPWYTRITWKDEKNVSATFIFAVAGSMALVIPGLLLNLSLQRNYEAGYYIHQEEQQALFGYKFRDNLAVIKDCTDTVASQVLADLNTRTDILLNVISDAEMELIAIAEGEPGTPAVITRQIIKTDIGPVINFKTLIHPFHSVPAREYLLNEGSDMRAGLEAALSDYSGYLSGLIPGSGFSQYKKLLDPSVYFPEINPETDRVSLMSGLHMLGLLKNGVLTVESYALSEITGSVQPQN